MYYNGLEQAFYIPGSSIGRATAENLTGPWIKDEHPVLTTGKKGEWDAGFIIPSSVLALKDGSFLLYYSGGVEIEQWNDFYIGLAFSDDGRYWKKYNDPATKERPFMDSDPVVRTGAAGGNIENSFVLFTDSICFMYYDYCGPPGKIGVAVARVP
jgi:hypothetical protein